MTHEEQPLDETVWRDEAFARAFGVHENTGKHFLSSRCVSNVLTYAKCYSTLRGLRSLIKHRTMHH